MTIAPLRIGKATIQTTVDDGRFSILNQQVSITNLAIAVDDDVGVVEYVTVFTTAKDVAFHPGRTVDGDVSIAHVGSIVVGW